MQPASRAPGVSSVGMIRAIAASIVARWCGSKNVSGMAVLMSRIVGVGRTRVAELVTASAASG